MKTPTRCCLAWIMVATDASPDYGFGVSVATASSGEVRQLAHALHGSDIFVRPGNEQLDERPRIGTCRRLPVPAQAFRSVISKRADVIEHSGAMEATAVTLGLRWLARTAKHHGHRGVLLIDAQAVLHAHRKGRSSAGTLTRPLRRAAAVVVAAVVEVVAVAVEVVPVVAVVVVLQ